ncbi:TetR/AcrR family transcriptional regulator [Schumannella luteola]
MARDVRERMIESTSLLLAKKGLQGASFSEILDASGAPRGSLYHHFPKGKDELVLAAVDRAGERAMSALDSMGGMDARRVAESFLGLWRTVLERSGFTVGCAVLAVTVAAEEPDLVEGAATVFRSWRSRLAALLVAGGVPADRGAAAAASLIAASEGAVVLARAERSLEPFDLVAAAQLDALEAML